MVITGAAWGESAVNAIGVNFNSEFIHHAAARCSIRSRNPRACNTFMIGVMDGLLSEEREV
jgi:hypothetical protein